MATTYKYIPKYEFKSSPNHFDGRHGWKPDVIVFHQTGGPTIGPAVNWFMTPGAISAHFLCDTDGSIIQCVDLNNGSYCNGSHVDPNSDLFYGYARSRLVKERKTNCNYYSYSIEFVHCAKGDITTAQINAAIELIQKVIIPHMKSKGVTPIIDREHLIGHCDVTPRTRAFCPGVNFPYDKIINGVNKNIYYKDISPNVNTLPSATDASTDVIPAVTTTSKSIYYSCGQAAIRTNYSKASAIYGRCKRGAYYLIDAIVKPFDNTEWLVHTINGKKYYSMKSDGGQVLFKEYCKYESMTTTATINARSSPKLDNTKANVVTQFKQNTKIAIQKNYSIKQDGIVWYRALYNNQFVFVASQYLK